MKKTTSWLTLLATLVTFSCSKTSEENIKSNSTQSQSNATTTVPPDVAALLKTYNLHPSSSYGLVINYNQKNFAASFSDTASAGAFIRKQTDLYAKKQVLAFQSFAPSSGGNPNAKIQPICNEPGTYGAVFGGLAGMFTACNITMHYTGDLGGGSILEDFNVYFTGFPFFWSWKQQGYASGVDGGCIWGTITWGISIRGIPTSRDQPYQIRLTKNGCTLTATAGGNVCF